MKIKDILCRIQKSIYIYIYTHNLINYIIQDLHNVFFLFYKRCRGMCYVSSTIIVIVSFSLTF